MSREGDPRSDLCRRALGRLTLGERAVERDRRRVPYRLSLHALAGHFLEAGTRQGWLSAPNGAPVLLAVSGGGDSMAMLWLFRALYPGPIVAAHVNHGIRGEEADGDAAFVRRMAGLWGLPFVERRVDVPGERRPGESIEAAARRARHRELLDMAGECGAWGVALGHNRDDLAETVLFNLLRGTGPRGAAGIPERRGPFFRPVLGLRREFLRDILRVRGIVWREDRTNELTETSAGAGYTRNFIRLELLPLIEARINVGAVERLAAFGEEMREYREDEEARGRALVEGALISSDEGGLALDRGRVMKLSPFERALLLREAGRRLGLTALSRGRAVELARLMGRPGPFVFQWGGGASVRGEGDAIRWTAPRSVGGAHHDLTIT